METKNIVIGLGVVIVIVSAVFMMKEANDKDIDMPKTQVAEQIPDPIVDTTNPASPTSVTTVTTSSKEFTMNSWMETVNGKMSAYFSLKEMVVKKGDKVKIVITNTAGTHDFKIDAYNIAKDTPLNEATVIEFTADKVGDFEYYCSKYNHRSIGQTGMLRVVE